jgi:hypothetical protein
MPTKVQFIGESSKQYTKKQKKKNIEKVYDKQQDTK